MSEQIKNFKDLKIWQNGIILVEKIYALTKTFPKEELYCLSSQMRRASISIPSNIAEGFRRKHTKEYQQFLNIALGSCAELETQLIVAHKISLLSQEQLVCLSEQIEVLCKMISSLKAKLTTHDPFLKTR